MKQFTHSGSTVLFVLLITSMLMTYAVLAWRSCSYAAEVVRAQEQYERNFRLCESLMHSVITHCKNNFDSCKKQNSYVIQWPPQSFSDHIHCEGHVTLAPVGEQGLKITVNLNEKGRSLVGLSCVLLQEVKEGDEPLFVVTEWKHEKNSE